MKNLIFNNIREKLSNFMVSEGSEQRSVGDIVEFKIRQILMDLPQDGVIKESLLPRSKKSIEDVTLVGTNGVNYRVDPKTHDIHSEFSMPNLSSVEKLRKLLENKNEELIYIFVSYVINGLEVSITKIDVKYLWELSFEMLRIGSLGKGQLQISNMHNELKFTNIGKLKWLDELKSKVREYHNQRIKQIEKDKLKWL